MVVVCQRRTIARDARAMHHFRICPMREAIMLRRACRGFSHLNNVTYTKVPMLHTSSLSLRSCHVSLPDICSCISYGILVRL